MKEEILSAISCYILMGLCALGPFSVLLYAKRLKIFIDTVPSLELQTAMAQTAGYKRFKADTYNCGMWVTAANAILLSMGCIGYTETVFILLTDIAATCIVTMMFYILEPKPGTELRKTFQFLLDNSTHTRPPRLD